jgi:type I restriction enzyme S subunit
VGNLFTSDHWYYSDMELKPQKYCEQGDLLYAWSASFGPFIWNGPKVIFHYHIWKVECTDVLKREYARAVLQLLTDQIKEDSHGLGMLHMTKEYMETYSIPLPPLPEQERICATLDLEMSTTSKARDAAEAELEAINALPAALLRRAFNGEL